jgi:hypothetical protein
MKFNSAMADDITMRIRDDATMRLEGPAVRPADRIAVCGYCMERVLPTMSHCPRCLHEMPVIASSAPPAGESQPVAAAPRSTGAGAAMYTLESPVRCPHCEQEIRTFKVLRVLRTQASFTSTLPRKGYVIVCPECERMMSAELSGLV